MKTRILGILVLMTVMVIPAFAASDMYLQIDGIAGVQTDTAHKDWIPVSEIQDSIVKPGGVISLVINKAIDGNSGLLYKDCIMATPRPRATLDISKDGTLIYRMMLMSPTITQIKPRYTKTDSAPQEELSFNFKSITWEFYSVGADGKPVTTRTGWDNDLKRAL